MVTSSYTANLAAFLTVERMESPIESAEDLAKQTKIKYGCLESGSTRAFFRDSKMPTFSRMHAFMESQKNPKTFTSSNKEGVQRVIDSSGEYAFLMESNSIQYQVERNCDLLQVGKLLDSKGYGIAFTPGSLYRVPISGAILQLQEAGRLHILKNRWWKQRRGGGKCDESTKKTEANELSFDSFGGVFVVLIAGMGIACLISVLEFFWKRRSLEAKTRGTSATSLVAQALVNTNCETFNTVRQRDFICAKRMNIAEESPTSSLNSNDLEPSLLIMHSAISIRFLGFDLKPNYEDMGAKGNFEIFLRMSSKSKHEKVILIAPRTLVTLWQNPSQCLSSKYVD